MKDLSKVTDKHVKVIHEWYIKLRETTDTETIKKYFVSSSCK